MNDTNYITLVQADKPINKSFSMKNGKLVKDKALALSVGKATTMYVPELKDMRLLLESIARDPCAVLIAGFILEQIGNSYQVLSMKRIAEATGCGEDEARNGAHMIDEVTTYARTKDNFVASSWIMFDVDVPEGMPDKLIARDPDQWGEWMDQIISGFAGAGKVILPSNSTRVRFDDKPYAAAGLNYHVYVQTADAGDRERFKGALLPHAYDKGYGFRRGNGTPWTIFDPGVFGAERLVYDGAPEVGKGLTLDDPDIRVIEGDTLDTYQLKTLHGDSLRKFYKATGQRYTYEPADGEKPGRSYWTDDRSLTLDMELDTGKEPITVEAFQLSDVKKLRCQTPFRESVSQAAFIARDRRGVFLYDTGTNTKYVLNGPGPSIDKWMAKAKSLPVDGWIDTLPPVFQGIARHEPGEIEVDACLNTLNDLAQGPSRNSMLTKLRSWYRLATKGLEGFGQMTPAMSGIPSLGVMLAEYDAMYGVVKAGGKTRIVFEQKQETGFYASVYTTAAELREFHLNDRALRIKDGVEVIEAKPFEVWRHWSKRRTYSRVTFEPKGGVYCEGERPLPDGDAYNEFRGFPLRPKECDCGKIKWHIRHILCAGDEVKYEWLMDLLACWAKYPERTGLVTPIFKSNQGAGKGHLAVLMGRLLGSYLTVIDDPEQLTRKFNQHLSLAVGIVLNESTWGGNKKNSQIYKSRLQDPLVLREPKGIDPWLVPNRAKGMIFTNEDQGAPVEKGDRRHAGFLVSDEKAGDREYFTKLAAEIAGEGAAAFLYELVSRDVKYDAMRHPPGWDSPVTEDAMLMGLDSVDGFWYSMLSEGVAFDCPEFIDDPLLQELGIEPTWENCEMYLTKNQVHQAYIENCTNRHDWRPLDNGVFFKMTKSKYPALYVDERRNVRKYKKARGMLFPRLSLCRAVFENKRGTITWD